MGRIRRSLFLSVFFICLIGLAAASAASAQSLEELARREGRVVWYTSVGLPSAEKIANLFTEKYGIHVEVNRSGSERVFTRVLQEAQAGVFEADVIHTSDAGHYEYLKEMGLLAQYKPAGIDAWDDIWKDPDGYYFVWRAGVALPIYNPNLVSPEELPRKWTDFLHPRWQGRLAKGHPGYSGFVLTHTAALVNQYGWEFFRELAKLDVMQLQSANDPPQTVANGERAAGVEGTDYLTYQLRAQGNPIDFIMIDDGVPFVASPSGVAAKAPNPNAARFFTDFLFSLEAQQAMVDAGFYSGHPEVVYAEDKPALSDMNLWVVSAKELLDRADEIKEMYSDIFGL